MSLLIGATILVLLHSMLGWLLLTWLLGIAGVSWVKRTIPWRWLLRESCCDKGVDHV